MARQDGGQLAGTRRKAPRKDTPLKPLSFNKLVGVALGFGTLLLLAGLALVGSRTETPAPDGVGGPPEPQLPEIPAAEVLAALQNPAVAESTIVPEESFALTIRQNETFYDAMQRVGAPHEDIMDLVAACKPYRDLSKIRVGDVFKMVQAADSGVRRLSFDLDLESYLVFQREGDSYRVLEQTYPVERRVCATSGDIEVSLFESLKRTGAPVSLASKVNDILGWEIDFNRDLRVGDSFKILYEEMWKDGELVRTGHILALECINRGTAHRAYRFEDAGGRPSYYDPAGKSFQKQLLRAPLNYSRISSSFSYRRFHPVLKRWMPHLGVDYAAPVGTPVRAAGDGVVVEASRNEANGRFIHIRHTNRSYETYYLHFSRLAEGIHVGAKVRQGQVIGYVGATGYATGPHLDFRVKKDGTFVDPRRLKLPAAAPVGEESHALFDLQVAAYDETLAGIEGELAPAIVAVHHPVLPPLQLPNLSGDSFDLTGLVPTGE